MNENEKRIGSSVAKSEFSSREKRRRIFAKSSERKKKTAKSKNFAFSLGTLSDDVRTIDS
jgi:hypothetical protein